MTIAAGRVVNFPDILNGPGVPDGIRTTALAAGRHPYNSIMLAPLMQAGQGIGTIILGRQALGGFTDREQALFKTFADQAVIAIQNARLFKQLEARNRDVTEALEQQTATAEILGVISSSPTDLQPVLDAITRSAARLCGAMDVVVFLVDGEGLLPLFEGKNTLQREAISRKS